MKKEVIVILIFSLLLLGCNLYHVVLREKITYTKIERVKGDGNKVYFIKQESKQSKNIFIKEE